MPVDRRRAHLAEQRDDRQKQAQKQNGYDPLTIHG
jgi:hypothetical protein